MRLIRHATLIVEYSGHKLIVDPMLDDAEARPPIQNSPNPRNNPLVALPLPAAEVLEGVQAVLVTHTHSDHWDAMAAELISKRLPLFGQPEDEAKFRSQGFEDVRAIGATAGWNDIGIVRTGGQHAPGRDRKGYGAGVWVCAAGRERADSLHRRGYDLVQGG